MGVFSTEFRKHNIFRDPLLYYPSKLTDILSMFIDIPKTEEHNICLFLMQISLILQNLNILKYNGFDVGYRIMMYLVRFSSQKLKHMIDLDSFLRNLCFR